MIEVRLPREGSTTMAAGVILEWLVAVGEEVAEGQVLAEIETDKVSFEVVAPGSGIVRQLCAEVGQEVEVGAVILRIGSPAEPLDGSPADEEQPPEASEQAPGASPSRSDGDLRPAATARSSPSDPIRASPAARRVARDLGVALERVPGTGPGARITSSDVRRFSQAVGPESRGGAHAASEPVLDPLRGLTGHRAVVARRMSQASSETASVTLMMRADVTPIVHSEFSLADVVTYQVVLCVTRHPEINASLTPDGIVTHPTVGLGYAVNGARGLIVPVVHDAQSLDAARFAVERRRVVRAALDGTLQPSDLVGGTFTVSNLGSSGVEHFTPIITPGQSAVLGLGSAALTAVALDEAPSFAVRSLITLSLTFDHRILDGAGAAEFLHDVKSTLQSWRPGS